MIFKKNADGSVVKATRLLSGDKLIINARVRNLKPSKKLTFLELQSGLEVLTAVYRGSSLLPCEGDYISANAVVKTEIKAKNGLETEILDFKILSASSDNTAASDFEDMQTACSENALQNKPLSVRSTYLAAVYSIKSAVLSAFYSFMEDNDFISVTSPVISAFTEGKSFKTDYFGADAYLSHSPQIYMTTCTAALERVFEAAHSFSAKQHNSTRHLNEYTSLNFQMGYISSLDEIISVVTEYLRFTAEYLQKHSSNAIERLGMTLPSVTKIPVFTFDSVLSMLGKEAQFDLDPTDIRKICERVFKEHGSEFVFVTDFPPDKRPFYVLDDGNRAKCFDLFFRGQKLATGSINIHDYNLQLEKMNKYNVNAEDFDIYMRTLKYGIMPYGGFTLGLERFIWRLVNADNIRVAAQFPRDLHHLKP